MRLSKPEQETIIGRAADEDSWEVYSCDPAMVRRFERVLGRIGISCTKDEWGAIRVLIPKDQLKISCKARTKERTEAERAAIGARLNEARRRKTGQ